MARIVELRRAGRPYRGIATSLDAQGHKPRRAASWSAATVRNVALRAMDDVTPSSDRNRRHPALRARSHTDD